MWIIAQENLSVKNRVGFLIKNPNIQKILTINIRRYNENGAANFLFSNTKTSFRRKACLQQGYNLNACKSKLKGTENTRKSKFTVEFVVKSVAVHQKFVVKNANYRQKLVDDFAMM